MSEPTTILHPDQQILVTGAGGFIGGHIVGTLRRQGFHRLRAVDIKPLSSWYQSWADVENINLDLRIKDACMAATAGVDHVINLAADMGGMGFISTHKTDCMLNVLINAHLLGASKEHGIRTYFFASSACVYSQLVQSTGAEVRLREEHAWPALPEEGYGLEKLFSEELCRFFREEHGMATSVARYHNVYGPYGAYDGGREKAPAALCRKVAEATLSGSGEIEIWGDGTQRRSFLYVDDAVEGTLRLIGSSHPGPVNIGSEESVTINELVDLIEEIAGTRCKRLYQKHRPEGVRSRCSDNQKMRALTGWEPAVELAMGLEQTYRWIFDCLSASRPLGSGCL
jgi:nucleoside-diphosphate-sugar epimerase